MLLVCVLCVSAVLAELKPNQSAMVTDQPQPVSSFTSSSFTSSERPAADRATNGIVPSAETWSNLSGSSNVAGQRSFVHQHQDDEQPEWRIIGGQEAPPHSWPWQVSLQFASMPACGGAILSPQWVLSATHCFRRFSRAEYWTVVAGKHNLAEDEPEQQVVKVSRIISHDRYNPQTKENDVTLLKLQQPLRFTHAVRDIALCTASIPANRKCTITGWGATHENGYRVKRLREVNVTILPPAVCNQKHQGRVLPTMFCAGKNLGGVDACQGDSGGPLSCQLDNKRYELGGLVSWGVGCGRPNRPGVYVRLQMYIQWIHSVMAQEFLYADATDADEEPCGKAPGQTPPPAPPLANLSVDGLVGGVQRTRPGSWPWQVSLQDRHRRHLCSGVLLQGRWVLTARHCRIRAKVDVVVLASENLNVHSVGPNTVEEVVDYREGEDSPDLVLLRLSYSARLASGVTPVCLPDEDEELNDGWSCVTTGWGTVKTAEPLEPTRQHQVGLSLVNRTTCRQHWKESVRESHICCHTAGSSSCLGDSAAPLFCRKNGAYFLFGILSWGSRCSGDKPAVFTRVPDYLTWIDNKTRPPVRQAQ